MINEENYYEDREYLTNSMMGYLKKSPIHLQEYINRNIRLEGDELDFGSAYHCMILESEIFDKMYAVKPKGMRANSKAYKEWLADAYGRNVIAEPVYDTISRMRDVLMQNRDVENMLLLSQKEVIKTWEYHGVKCKGKFDMNHKDFMADLKTTRDSSESYFRHHANYTYDYDRQAAFYLMDDPKPFYFIAQEKTPPYIYAIFECSDTFIESGIRKYRKLIEDYRHLFIEGNIKEYKRFHQL